MSEFSAAVDTGMKVLESSLVKIEQEKNSPYVQQLKPEFQADHINKAIEQQMSTLDDKLDDVQYGYGKLSNKVNQERAEQSSAYIPKSKEDKMDLHLQTLVKRPYFESKKPKELLAEINKPRDLTNEDVRIELQILENEGERILKSKQSAKSATFRIQVQNNRESRISDETKQRIDDLNKHRKLYDHTKVMKLCGRI